MKSINALTRLLIVHSLSTLHAEQEVRCIKCENLTKLWSCGEHSPSIHLLLFTNSSIQVWLPVIVHFKFPLITFPQYSWILLSLRYCSTYSLWVRTQPELGYYIWHRPQHTSLDVSFSRLKYYYQSHGMGCGSIKS